MPRAASASSARLEAVERRADGEPVVARRAREAPRRPLPASPAMARKRVEHARPGARRCRRRAPPSRAKRSAISSAVRPPMTPSAGGGEDRLDLPRRPRPALASGGEAGVGGATAPPSAARAIERLRAARDRRRRARGAAATAASRSSASSTAANSAEVADPHRPARRTPRRPRASSASASMSASAATRSVRPSDSTPACRNSPRLAGALAEHRAEIGVVRLPLRRAGGEVMEADRDRVVGPERQLAPSGGGEEQPPAQILAGSSTNTLGVIQIGGSTKVASGRRDRANEVGVMATRRGVLRTETRSAGTRPREAAQRALGRACPTVAASAPSQRCAPRAAPSHRRSSAPPRPAGLGTSTWPGRSSRQAALSAIAGGSCLAERRGP